MLKEKKKRIFFLFLTSEKTLFFFDNYPNANLKVLTININLFIPVSEDTGTILYWNRRVCSNSATEFCLENYTQK